MKARIVVLLVSLALLGSFIPIGSMATAGAPVKQEQSKMLQVDAENVELVGQFDTPGSASRVAVDGSYAYVADYDEGLRVIDISDPTHPREVGYYDMPGPADWFLDVAIANGYAYVAKHRGKLLVIDISDPTNPHQAGSSSVSLDAERLVVVGDYAYVTGWCSGLSIVDVYDPTHPTVVGYCDPGHWNEYPGVEVSGDYAYVATDDVGGDSNGLWIIDISNPAAPYEVGRYYPEADDDVAVLGNYAYVVGGRLLVIDVSDPLHPEQLVASWVVSDGKSIAVNGNYAYVCDSYETLRVIDISDPPHPREVGYYSTHREHYGSGFRHVAVDGGYIYVTKGEAGLLIFRFTGGPPPCDLSKQPPVLLVPGWGGSEASLAADEQLHYFRDWLGPDYVEGCNLFYATGVADEKSTWQNALAIQESLQVAYDACIAVDPNWDGHFDIVGHSYGGINSRQYLESILYIEDQSYREKGVHVDNLFTLGTPHAGGTPELPGALIKIALKHIIDPLDWPSLWQLTPWEMWLFNSEHSQPEDVCYRLVGGDAFEQDLPWQIQLLYDPFQFDPNDLGVYRESAQELIWWGDKYPDVLVEDTPDMHGYCDMLGLDKVRSYVHPSDTFDEVIRPYLGNRQCVADGRVWSVSAEPTTSPPPVPAVLVASGEVSSGTMESGTFGVNWSGQSVIYLNWPLGELELSLTDPDGQLVDPSTAQSDPNVDYFELDVLAQTATYVFTDTIVGSWGYTITAASLPDTMPYRLILLPSLPVAVTAQVTPWQPQGQPAIISGTLTYSVTTPLTGADVQALISRPDVRMDTLNLYDDGVHYDKMAGDGIYGNSYGETDVGGYYAVVVEASGTYQMEPYARTAETVFTVATGAASLSGEYSDQPYDTNGDGRYEWLDIDAEVSVTQVGTYTLAADLVADDGSYIGHAMLRTGLVTGTHNLKLSFDGDDILESGQDGPYTITNVLLVDSEYASLLLDQADNAHQTAAYHYWQFGSGWRLYLPVVLRNH